ncbi:MAG: ribosomal RNA small subunit methyltransferase A [Solirubrobacterales bacterium]|nr:ribosomal RNA small subunit methyltransferase A [Solirubrobacterales bacterium]MCB8970897.1 ribosomal RNA small subunit methyltransferase A [Thermoleophilales bacterium]MCO5326207.1 16S rRNA (adenine(1518)-N(6)/adenine(1519)-N(6))-dimethyltransferase RsmA [Solirubrobacterales bacterium]
MVRLGQNFLADPNLLEAIVADAALDADDVVLEVGGGEGVLTRRLAERVARVHLIEIDERLRPALDPIEAGHAGLEIVWGDAMEVDLGALTPPPTAMVANLPYSVATPVLLRTITELPSVRRWTVMVQREIAERLRARPGTRMYGSPSVLVQLACEVRMLRTVDPAVFKPRPRVESAVLSLRRRAEAPPERYRQLIRDAFAHRRKALPKSMELAVKRREAEAERAGLPPPRPRSAEVRHACREALVRLGLPADARAEMLTPPQHLALAEAIG